MIRIKSVFLPGLLVAVLLIVSSLHADTITSSSVTVAATDAAGHGALSETTSFSLPEFDPSLGTLTGIEVDLTLTYQGEIDVINFSNALNPFTGASSTVPIDLITPSTPSPGSLLVAAIYDPLPSGLSGNANPPQFAFTDFLGPTTTNFPVSYNPAPVDFANYEGLGSNSYGISYGAGTYFVSGNLVGSSGDANSSGTASVTYTFTPTPEPSSLVLFCIGATALAALARRRMRTRAA